MIILWYIKKEGTGCVLSILFASSFLPRHWYKELWVCWDGTFGIRWIWFKLLGYDGAVNCCYQLSFFMDISFCFFCYFWSVCSSILLLLFLLLVKGSNHCHFAFASSKRKFHYHHPGLYISLVFYLWGYFCGCMWVLQKCTGYVYIYKHIKYDIIYSVTRTNLYHILWLTNSY